MNIDEAVFMDGHQVIGITYSLFLESHSETWWDDQGLQPDSSRKHTNLSSHFPMGFLWFSYGFPWPALSGHSGFDGACIGDAEAGEAQREDLPRGGTPKALREPFSTITMVYGSYNYS